jgi:hypothetical protein
MIEPYNTKLKTKPIKNMIETCNKHFKTIGISKLRNTQNMTQNMIEIKTLLSETMLGSCLYTMFFQVVLNHNPLEKVGVHCPYCKDISYIWDIICYGP